eukprot:gene6275-9430_t
MPAQKLAPLTRKKAAGASPAEAAAMQAAAAAVPDPEPCVLSLAVVKARMIALYSGRWPGQYLKHRPAQARSVDGLLAKYPGREEEVLKKTCKLFGEDWAVAHELNPQLGKMSFPSFLGTLHPPAPGRVAEWRLDPELAKHL